MHYYTCGNFVLAAVATLKFGGYDLQTIAPVTKTAVKALFRHYVQRSNNSSSTCLAETWSRRIEHYAHLCPRPSEEFLAMQD